MKIELLRCPFCGSLPKIESSWFFGFDVACSSSECGVRPTDQRGVHTESEAIAIWNCRYDASKDRVMTIIKDSEPQPQPAAEP